MYFLYSKRTSRNPSLLIQSGRKGPVLDFGVGSLPLTTSLNFIFLHPVKTGFGVSVWARLKKRTIMKESVASVQFCHLCTLKNNNNNSMRLELSGCLSCSQIYLGSSTNEIKLLLYHSLDCEEYNIIPFTACHALSLTITSKSVRLPKSTATMRTGSGWISADQFHLATQTHTVALV